MKTDLPDLPGTENKEFWMGDNELIPEPIPVPCDHYFIRRSAREVECRECKSGFYVEPGDIILKGSIYRGSEKLM